MPEEDHSVVDRAQRFFNLRFKIARSSSVLESFLFNAGIGVPM
jgi:hypothetical protein